MRPVAIAAIVNIEDGLLVICFSFHLSLLPDCVRLIVYALAKNPTLTYIYLECLVAY